jgi:CRP/FNR family cyclic AMP-dependent transcriptional regulator
VIEKSGEITRETYKPGEFIFFEGDVDFHFYIIDSGEVQIFTKNTDGARINIATIEPGESFGEFALLDRAPRSASAQALTNVSLFRVSEKGFEKLLEELPIWASSMLRSFAVRLKNMNEVLKTVPQFLKK